MDCVTCGKKDDQKPMAFRGEPYCSERHRKTQAAIGAVRLYSKDEILAKHGITKNENSVVE